MKTYLLRMPTELHMKIKTESIKRNIGIVDLIIMLMTDFLKNPEKYKNVIPEQQ